MSKLQNLKKSNLNKLKRKTKAEEARDNEIEELRIIEEKKRLGHFYRDIEFADDPNLYNQRVDRDERIQYWKVLSETPLHLKRDIRHVKNDSNLISTWVDENRTNNFEVELKTFPAHKIFLLKLLFSSAWDYLYLVLLIFWIVAISLYLSLPRYTKLLDTISDNAFLLLPLLGMAFTQAIPIFSACYFVPWCNDLVKLIATKYFGFWSIGAVITSQYLEYTYFGGKGTTSRAGTCRKNSQNITIRKKKRKFFEFAPRIFPETKKRTTLTDSPNASHNKSRLSYPESKYTPSATNDNNEDSNNAHSKSNGFLNRFTFSKKSPLKLVTISKLAVNKQNNNLNNSKINPNADSPSPSTKAPGKSSLSIIGKKKDASPTSVLHELTRDDTSNQISLKMTAQVPSNKDDNKVEVDTNDNAEATNNPMESVPSPTLMVTEDHKTLPVTSPSDKSHTQSILSNTSRTTTSTTAKVGGGYLRRKEQEKKRMEEEKKLAELEEKRLRELHVTDWTEWLCVVCGKDNRLPTQTPQDYNIVFKERGIRYKRDIAVLVPQSLKPKCVFCGTPSDYVPPLGTAHLFIHNPDPERAFGNYPAEVKVQAGLPTGKALGRMARLKAYCLSVLFGMRDHPRAKAVKDDWRLPLYLAVRFPEVPRPSMRAERTIRMRRGSAISSDIQLYDVGETVECRLQRADWCRAKVLVSRINRTYDIRYDSGVELRFVRHSDLRAPPLKGYYAYQVELCLILCLLTSPLAITAALLGYEECILLPQLLSGVWLLILNILSFIRHVGKYSDGGCLSIFILHLIFLTPLFFLSIASALPLQSYSWLSVVAVLIIAKISAIPILYMMRPSFAVMASLFFVQTSMCLISLAKRLDNDHRYSLAVFPCVLGVSSAVTLLVYRYLLVDIWDVSIRIRPGPEEFKHVTPVVDYRSVFMWLLSSPSKVSFRRTPKASTKSSNIKDDGSAFKSNVTPQNKKLSISLNKLGKTNEAGGDSGNNANSNV